MGFANQAPVADRLVRMVKVDKRFEGVHALRGVDFELSAGEVHALVGENGAGKSTLMKILSGVYSQDSGDVLYKGERISFIHPSQAQHAGIIMVPQEINLVPYMRVYENVFLGTEPVIAGFLKNRRKMIASTRELLEEQSVPT